jgi:hypothetical protein
MFKLHPDDRRILFIYVIGEAAKALAGEFNPVRGGLKRFDINGETILRYIPPDPQAFNHDHDPGDEDRRL